MKLIYKLSDRTVNLQKSRILAIYYHRYHTCKVNLPAIWIESDNPTIAKFIKILNSVMTHESIHEAVQTEIDDSKINLLMFNTANEWITKRLNDEPIKDMTLMNYVIKDMSNHPFDARIKTQSRAYRIAVNGSDRNTIYMSY